MSEERVEDRWRDENAARERWVRERDIVGVALEAIAATEACPCPCCGEHDSVRLAKDALATLARLSETPT
jgi:hypothetical protein